MQWPGREYILGTNQKCADIAAQLPEGRWLVKRFDVAAKSERTLDANASGLFRFSSPESRSVFFSFKKRGD